jgi:hypothetical protein
MANSVVRVVLIRRWFGLFWSLFLVDLVVRVLPIRR